MSLIFRIRTSKCIPLGLQAQGNSVRQVCSSPKRFSLNNRLRRIGSPAEVERVLKEKDKIPKDYELIYRSVGGAYFAAAKYCVMLSTAAVVALAGWELFSHEALIPTPVPDVVYGGLVVEKNDLIYFSAGFILINVAFSAILRRYPLRIYKKVDKYIATYESQLPFKGTYQHNFSKGDVREVHQLLNPWKDRYYRLGSRNSLLFDYYFKTPSEFNQMF